MTTVQQRKVRDGNSDFQVLPLGVLIPQNSLNNNNNKMNECHPPVECKHNQGIPGDAHCSDDKDKERHNVMGVVWHLHLLKEAALGVGLLGLHALSGPHGSSDSSTLLGLPARQQLTEQRAW